MAVELDYTLALEVLGTDAEVLGASLEVLGADAEVLGASLEVLGADAEVLGASLEVLRASRGLPASARSAALLSQVSGSAANFMKPLELFAAQA